MDNTAVRKEQVEGLKKLRAERDNAAVQEALNAITACVQEFKDGKKSQNNLLDLAVKAAAARATLGEISDACEKVGRYKATIKTISNVYSAETKNDPDYEEAVRLTEQFAKKEGRRPRIMIAKMGQEWARSWSQSSSYGLCRLYLMWIWARCSSRLLRKLLVRLWKMMFTCLVSALWAAGHKTLIPAVVAELKKLA